MFCLQLSVRDVHTWGLLNGRRPLSSCYLELVIRGSMAQLPGLFSTFQIYSAFAICCQFYGLIVIYAYSSRLHVYLVSRKSAHRFVLVSFFLCVVLLASRNVSLFHDFRSCAPGISPVDLGRVVLNYARYSVCDGVPGSAWLVAPFFPLYFFFQFRFKAFTWGICALPSWQSISNYFAFRHCLTSVKTQEIPSDLITPGVTRRGACQLGRSASVSLIGLRHLFG